MHHKPTLRAHNPWTNSCCFWEKNMSIHIKEHSITNGIFRTPIKNKHSVCSFDPIRQLCNIIICNLHTKWIEQEIFKAISLKRLILTTGLVLMYSGCMAAFGPLQSVPPWVSFLKKTSFNLKRGKKDYFLKKIKWGMIFPTISFAQWLKVTVDKPFIRSCPLCVLQTEGDHYSLIPFKSHTNLKAKGDIKYVQWLPSLLQ